MVGPGEELLPPSASRPHSPQKELAPLKPLCRDLNQPFALAVKGSDPRTPAFRDVKEKVGGPVNVSRIRDVRRLDIGHGNPPEPIPTIAKRVRRIGRHNNTRVGALGYSHVGPPVHGHPVWVWVCDPDAHIEHRRPFRQVGIDLEGDLPDPLPLVHSQNGRTVHALDPRRMERRAGKRTVANGTNVPFDATAEPRIADRQVGRLENGIDRQQLAAGSFV